MPICCLLPVFLSTQTPPQSSDLFLLHVQAREDFDVRVMQLTKQRREGVMKAKTGRGGETRFEARLNSKKHRSTSRRKVKQQGIWGDEDNEEFERDV